MPPPLKPFEEVLQNLLQVFRERGYDGASLAELSQASGLGRSSLYHYFPGGKEDMARAVFAHVGEWMQAQVLAVLTSDGAPLDRVKRALRVLSEFYAGGTNPCLLGAMSMGQGRVLLGTEVGAAFRQLIEAFARTARDAGVPKPEALRRAEDLVVRLQGALLLVAATGDPGTFKRVIDHGPAALLAPKA